MPLRPLLKNKLLLQKHFNVNEYCMNDWAYWMFEENIKIVNDLIEEEEKQKKTSEGEQAKNTPNFNPSSYMKDMSGIANKFK